MIEKLREINERLIRVYDSNKEKLERQKLIKDILKEENCFMKMPINTSLSILEDLGINNKDAKIVYEELISYENITNN